MSNCSFSVLATFDSGLPNPAEFTGLGFDYTSLWYEEQDTEILQRIKGIGIVELSQRDIVRHRLVQAIVEAYKIKQDAHKRTRRGENS